MLWNPITIGLGAEVAKNLVLAGIGALTILGV
jgi:molybdopterin/thiamine biosynthesis adenylyltransferase